MKDGPVEKLSFRRVNIVIVTAFHDDKVVTPAPSHFKVILRRGKRLGLTFLERCPRLKQHFFRLFVFMYWWRMERLFLWVLAFVNVSYAGELISRVGILNPETVLKLLWPLVEILPIEGVIYIVVFAEGHIETIIPVGRLPAGKATLVPILPSPLRLWTMSVERPRISWVLLLEAVIMAISRVHHHLWVRHAIEGAREAIGRWPHRGVNYWMLCLRWGWHTEADHLLVDILSHWKLTTVKTFPYIQKKFICK